MSTKGASCWGGGGVQPGATPPGTIMRSGPLRMYFEFLNRTQTLNFGFFGEGECDFQRKVAIVEICRLPPLSKNPEYYTSVLAPFQNFLDPLLEIIVYLKRCYKNVHWVPCISQVQTTGPL